MKNILFIFAALLFIVSCSDSKKESTKKVEKKQSRIEKFDSPCPLGASEVTMKICNTIEDFEYNSCNGDGKQCSTSNMHFAKVCWCDHPRFCFTGGESGACRPRRAEKSGPLM